MIVFIKNIQQPRYWPSLLLGWGWAAQQFVACGTLIPGGGKPIQWAPNAPAEATAVGRRCANGNGLRLTPGFAEGGRRVRWPPQRSVRTRPREPAPAFGCLPPRALRTTGNLQDPAEPLNHLDEIGGGL